MEKRTEKRTEKRNPIKNFFKMIVPLVVGAILSACNPNSRNYLPASIGVESIFDNQEALNSYKYKITDLYEDASKGNSDVDDILNKQIKCTFYYPDGTSETIQGNSSEGDILTYFIDEARRKDCNEVDILLPKKCIVSMPDTIDFSGGMKVTISGDKEQPALIIPRGNSRHSLL